MRGRIALLRHFVQKLFAGVSSRLRARKRCQGFLDYGVGRGCGVGRSRGLALGVEVGVAVAVGVGLGVMGGSLGVGVGDGGTVAVGVGVGEAVPPCGTWISTVIGEPVLKKPTVALAV